jgi:hypothetical protein
LSQDSITVSLIAFAAIFGGAIIGVLLRLALPEHQLAEDTKDVVRLCTGLIGTIAALVLGLLIASANSSYETQASQVRRLAANIILLDRLLAHYGPEARTARDLIRRAIDPFVDRIWREHSGAGKDAPYEASAAGAALVQRSRAFRRKPICSARSRPGQYRLSSSWHKRVCCCSRPAPARSPPRS